MWLSLSATCEAFFLNVLCNVDLKNCNKWECNVDFKLGLKLISTIFLTFLDESFCFLPRLSGLSTV